jgi:hypothetical protein
MKRLNAGLIPVVMVMFSVVSTANAALVSRLSGSAVYDDDLNVTWTGDANLAATNTFGVAGINANGTMNWATANSWITAMNNADYLGFNDWRLPGTLIPDDTSCTSDTAGNTASGDSTGFNCIGSEMGHLFYSELSGSAGNPVPGQTHFSDIQNDSIMTSSYFSSTEASSTDAWRFRFGTGSQFAVDKTFDLFAWAVRDGDVAAVPVPAAAWLFGSGLLGLVGVARRKVS